MKPPSCSKLLRLSLFLLIFLLFLICVMQFKQEDIEVKTDSITLPGGPDLGTCLFSRSRLALGGFDCTFEVIWNPVEVEVRKRLKPPTFIGGSDRAEESYISWLSNLFQKKYGWNSFPDLVYLNEKKFSGLMKINNGCVDVWAPGARKFSIFNERYCLIRHYRRGEATCPPPLSKKKIMHLEKLYFNAYGRNKKNFQHFVIDHLGPLIIAFQSAPKGTHFLADLNERSIEIAVAAGIPRSAVVTFSSATKYCADELYVDIVYPIDQKYLDQGLVGEYTEQEQNWVRDEKKPRGVIPQVSLPEHFALSSMQLAKAFRETHPISDVQKLHRDSLLFASRRPVRGKASSASGIQSSRPTRNLINEAELEKELRRIADLNKLNFVYFQPSKYSILDTQAKFLKAKVIVGVHGANMANQIFSGFDPSVTVIEVVGTKQFTKYENYQSYWYDGWSPFRYFLIGMRKEQVELMDVQRVFKFAGFSV